MKAIFLAFIFFCLSSSIFAQSHTISGYVIDKETGETLIGVNVIVKGTFKGAATDGNGFFRITGITPGNYTLIFSYIGYEKKEQSISLKNQSLIFDDVALKPEAIKLHEIVVVGEKSDIADVTIEPSHLELSPRAIKSIPASRNDVFRAIKYLPGIEGIDPFSPLFSVRGGDPGENLVLLDGVTIYNPYHFVTASGLFNLYAIKNIEMLIGGFGAEYGGRNSSVLYLTTREGNNKKLHGELETSTTQTNMIFDFPLGKNATMMISGRTYYDLVSRFLINSSSYFYDMNISLNWKLNKQNRLSLRYFYSRDLFEYNFARISSYFGTTFETDIFDDYDIIFKNKWSNQAITAILKTIISPKIYLQTQFSGSFFSSTNKTLFDFEYTFEEEPKPTKFFYSTNIKNKIEDIGIKSSLSFKLNSTNTLKFGGEYNRYYFNNDIQINYYGLGTAIRKPNLTAGFIEDKITIGPLSFRPGLRFSNFSFMKKWYQEPRLNLVFHLPNNYSLKAAWGRYYQYIISINSQEYELSQFLENYYPLKFSEPSKSLHYILGVEKLVFPNSHLSIDFYYKDLARLYTFDTNLSIVEASQFIDKLQQGTGKSYGLELMWRGAWNTFSGWISYGLSKSTRTYPHIMSGKEFLFDYDRTHSFKAVVNHQIHPALSYNGTLQILSGVPKTIERSVKSFYYYDPQINNISTQPSYVADVKNNARLPLYIRLDLGLTKRVRRGFAAELAKFLGAKESYIKVKFGNLLFLRRNVWFYMPLGEEKFYGVGSNYLPEFGMGYTIKF